MALCEIYKAKHEKGCYTCDITACKQKQQNNYSNGSLQFFLLFKKEQDRSETRCLGEEKTYFILIISAKFLRALRA